jgi:hypothetical protein
MDKRYQVFVSSTYLDLTDERQEVIQALLELDCIPAGMEMFPAADEDQWSLIKKVIDDCDYYIVIIGGRYGSLSTSGISYTEMEYDYAVEKGKPVIGFVHKDPSSISVSKTEQSEEGKAKLEVFREKVKRKVCRNWATPAELASVVSRSIVKLKSSRPAIGWVRADLVPNEDATQEILRLRRKVEELETSLEKTRLQAPEGIQELSQGDETFILHYSYTIRHRDESYIEETFNSTLPTTWNEIFAFISPRMIDGTAEGIMRSILRELIEARVTPKLIKKHKGYHLVVFNLMSEDFQTIKIQLRALGLITKDEERRSMQSDMTFWYLTPYGDNMMTKLRAIKKSTQN